jgi:ABC-type transport system substrate-binding protein
MLDVQRSRYHVLLSLISVGVLLFVAVGATPLAQARTAGSRPDLRHGGSINFNLGVVLDCADASKSGELASLYPANAMADTLVTQDPKGKTIPDLATKWKFSHHGLWITFNLRHGVKFSNGDAADAKAVAANLLRPQNNGVVGPVTSVKVNGRYQLTIVLSAPFRPALANLAFLVPIYDPKSLGPNDCESSPPVGTGSFKFGHIGTAFSTVEMKRNKLHNWALAYGHNHGPAYLSSFTFQSVSDPATAVSELLSGQLDITGITGPQLARVRGNKNIKLHTALQQSITWLGFNTSHKPFNKPQVRRAIGMAISRKAIIRLALNGQGKPSYSIVPPSIPYADPAAKSYAPPYNPSAAKKILAKNHVTGPYTLLGYTGVYAPVAEVVAAELQAVGVKVNVVLKPLADYFPAAAAGDFDLNVAAYFAEDPDFLYVNFHSSQETSTGGNYTFYKNKTLDKLIIKGREAVGTKAAARAYDAAQRLMVSTAAIVDPLYDPVATVGVRSRVGGYHRNIWSLFPVFQDLYVK